MPRNDIENAVEFHDETVYGSAPMLVSQNENAITLELSVPGYGVEDVSVSLTARELRIQGAPNKAIGHGRLVPGFTNILGLTKDGKVDASNTSDRTVSILNGILSISLPLQAEYRPATLEVTAC